MHRNAGGFTEEAQGRTPGVQTGFLQGRLCQGVLGGEQSTCKGVCLADKSISETVRTSREASSCPNVCARHRVMRKSCFLPTLLLGASEPSSRLGLHLTCISGKLNTNNSVRPFPVTKRHKHSEFLTARGHIPGVTPAARDCLSEKAQGCQGI